MLTLTPINLKTANAFVQQYHRHHKPTRGHKFSIGVSDNGALVGVAICGRPVARRLDDGYTLEVNWAKSYAQQVEDGFLIHHQNYQSAYKGKPAPSDTPMTARKRLEEKRPNTFIGRSFGVGDVIVWDEEKGRKFFYVDKEELVEFGGFMDADAAGNTVIYMVPNYQIDGKTGTWLPYDSEVVEGVCFFMMRNEQRKDAVSPVVVDSKGVFVTDAPNGFENVRSTLTEYVQRAEKKQQDMTEHEKCLTNGTYERARESGTEQNYDMIDGCVNNVPKKPRRIGGRWSVLDRLHIKQAQRKQKDQTQQQQQERSRKN